MASCLVFGNRFKSYFGSGFFFRRRRLVNICFPEPPLDATTCRCDAVLFWEGSWQHLSRLAGAGVLRLATSAPRRPAQPTWLGPGVRRRSGLSASPQTVSSRPPRCQCQLLSCVRRPATVSRCRFTSSLLTRTFVSSRLWPARRLVSRLTAVDFKDLLLNMAIESGLPS